MSPARWRVALASWRTAIRIARREARRARGRTALALAMITLPVAGLSFAAVSAGMLDLTPSERLARRLGTADAELRWVTDVPVRQDVSGDRWESDDSGPPPRTPRISAGDVAAALPPGSRVALHLDYLELRVRTPDGAAALRGQALDVADPMARGIVRVRAGRAPAGEDQVALSEAALRRLDTRIGGSVTLANGTRSWRVVGVVEFPDDLGEVIALPPSAQPADSPRTDGTWLVDTPAPVGWDEVRRLNARGIVVTSRDLVLHPPASAPGALDAGGTGPDADRLSTAALVGGLGLLEVVLLVGPAFAVGVRRRRRDLALVAANGGDAAHLRRIVLADGVVLGAAGALLGLLLGSAAAFAGRPLVEELSGVRAGGYRLDPAPLAGVAALAVAAGVLAALVPAYTAARQDVLDGLTGRRTPLRPRRRWLVVGLVLAATGTALAAVGATRPTDTVILTGLVTGELGLVLCTPSLVGLLGRAGRRLPLAPRIALRDTSRNRSSAAPAIAAIMAAVAGSVGIGMYTAATDLRSSTLYQPGLPPGYVMVGHTDFREDRDEVRPARIAEVARAHLPVTAVAELVVPTCPPATGEDGCEMRARPPADRACPYRPEEPLTRVEQRRARAHPYCDRQLVAHYSSYHETVVDDGTALPLLTGAAGADAARAAAVLRAGGVVVTDPRYLVDGAVTVDVTAPGAGPREPPLASVTVPGHLLRTGIGTDRTLLSPAVAARLGLSTRSVGYVLSTAAVPSAAEERRFATAVFAVAPLYVEVERGGPQVRDEPVLLVLAAAAGVITLGAAAIATGLAAADGRADLSTLAAVGAAPGVRRVLSLCQAGVVAGLGTVLGIAAGLVSATVILTALDRRAAETWPAEAPYPLVIPWGTLAGLVLVPVIAMLGAGLLTRSRLPVERRLD